MKIAAIFLLLAFSFVVNGAAQSAESHLAACGSETAESRLKDVRKAMSFFETLRNAVGRNDRAAVATMVRFPLRVNGRYRVTNRREFLKRYDQIFDSKVRAAIEKQRTECIFGNQQGFMAGLGDVWFEYSLKSPTFKVIAVNNDSWER